MRHFEPTQADEWKGGKSACTALLSTPILKLPPTDRMKAAGFNKFKSANLREAVLHFTGKPLENAHSALAHCHSIGFRKNYWAQQKSGYDNPVSLDNAVF